MNPAQELIARERELPPVSDEQVAKQAGRGDPDAFAAIFRRYERDLYRFCVGILGEPQDAQDALQNTMVKVLRALPGERREINLKPWLYRIAHNEAIELRRRQRPAEQLEPGIADLGLSVDERVERSERLQNLFRDMRDLAPRQRAALVMRELNGLEFDEIGTALETSPSAVRQALYEARRCLQQMEVGRQMDCEVVTRALSDEDGRLRARRDTRAHLRHCSDCRRFGREIGERRQTLAAISPLPALVVGGLLKSTLAGTGAGGAGAAAGGAGAAGVAGGIAAGGAATSGLVKSVAGLLAVAAIGTATADRAGLVDLPGERPAAIAREASQDRVASPLRRSGAGERGTTPTAGFAAADSRRAPARSHPTVPGEPGAGTVAAASPRAFVEAPARAAAPAAGGASHPTPADGRSATAPGTEPAAPAMPEHAAKPEGAGAGRPSQPQHPEHPLQAEPGPREGQEPKGESGTAGGQGQTRSEAKAEAKEARAEAKAEKAESRAEAKTEKAEVKAEKAEREPKSGSQPGAEAPAPAESSPPPQPPSEPSPPSAEPAAAAPEVAAPAESTHGNGAAKKAAEAP